MGCSDMDAMTLCDVTDHRGDDWIAFEYVDYVGVTLQVGDSLLQCDMDLEQIIPHGRRKR